MTATASVEAAAAKPPQQRTTEKEEERDREPDQVAPALARFLGGLDDQAAERFIDQLATLLSCLRDEPL